MRTGGHPTRKKEERLEARVSPETKALFREAARAEGRSLTNFVIHSALEAAQRALRERELLALTRRDRTAFVEALLHAPKPARRLQEAAHRHQRVLNTE